MKRSIFFGSLVAIIFSAVFASAAHAATLYFTPNSGSFTPGQTFRVTVMVDTQGEAVNAVAAYFAYDNAKFEALGVDTTGSAMTLFAEESAAGGRVDVSGGTPTPGFSGVQKIVSVDFRVRPAAAVGATQLTFAQDAAVLSDTTNQNVLNLGSSGVGQLEIVQASAPQPQPPAPQPQPIPQPQPQPQPPAPQPQPSPQLSNISISNVRVTQLESSEVQISWTTSEPTNARVNYGQEGVYAFSVIDGQVADSHSVILSGVDTSREYSFEVIGVTQSGEQVETGQLRLGEFVVESEAPFEQERIDQMQRGEFEVAGFEVRLSSTMLFLLVPMVVILLFGFILFWRMRARGV